MVIDIMMSAGEEGMVLQVKKGLLRYKKTVKWEGLLSKGSKRGAKKKKEENREKKEGGLGEIVDILKLFSISNVTVRENSNMPAKIYFFFYAFVFPHFGNIFLVKECNMADYFRMESVVDLKIIKGGKYLWKRLRKSLKD